LREAGPSPRWESPFVRESTNPRPKTQERGPSLGSRGRGFGHLSAFVGDE